MIQFRPHVVVERGVGFDRRPLSTFTGVSRFRLYPGLGLRVLGFTLSLSHSRTLALSHSHSLTLSLSHSLTLSLSLSRVTSHADRRLSLERKLSIVLSKGQHILLDVQGAVLALVVRQ